MGYSREYYLAHKDAYKVSRQKYYLKHRTAIRKKQKEYYDKNRERILSIKKPSRPVKPETRQRYLNQVLRVKMECPCGKILQRGSLYSHYLSNVHKRWLWRDEENHSKLEPKIHIPRPPSCFIK